MISTREEFLSAVRKADLTPQGMQIGPVAFVDGKDILLGKVTTEEVRRVLINKVRLAGTRYFAPGAKWEIPCSVKIKSKSKSKALATASPSLKSSPPSKVKAR